MTRHEAREQAFAVIFEKSFNETAKFQEIIENAEGDKDAIRESTWA